MEGLCSVPSVDLLVSMWPPSYPAPGNISVLTSINISITPHLFRFVKCEKCSHFFVVLSEQDQRAKATQPGQQTESKGQQGTANTRKPPPYPKKIYEYLNNHIIGQQRPVRC